MILELFLALAGLAPNVSPFNAPAAIASDDLSSLFANAQKDPAAVVPLIVEASSTIPTLDAKRAQLLGDTLEPFSRRAFFSPERLPDMERLGLVLHKVEQGENPTRIAQRYRIDAGLLGYLNKDYDERKLRAGMILKVLDLSDKSLKLVVQKSGYRLCAWRDLPNGKGRVLVAQVPVGLGANESPTPVGTTKITKRVLKPEWTNPVTKQTYADGDPNNVLGGYWIALDSEGIGKSGIGMHGYTGSAPASWIEQPASSGCVRMLQPDIDRVFHLAIEGTPVVIQP
jgi:lipoprotein-anchoring transpeptidase ErfK/SrfK